MIIGFLGKGGSGKTTFATRMTRWLHEHGNIVLAIDADHNMDLSYNLGIKDAAGKRVLGDAYYEIKERLGLGKDGKFKDGLSKPLPVAFTLTPPDDFTAAYAHTVAPRLSVMMAGPQLESVLNDVLCSHSLAAPLKLYLPYAHLSEKEYIIVDEKAGADAVSTGIPTGFDLAVVVVEPREHSIRVARQILDTLVWYDVPAVVVYNKWPSETPATLQTLLATLPEPAVCLPLMADPLAENGAFESLVTRARQASTPNASRLARSLKKQARADAYQSEYERTIK